MNDKIKIGKLTLTKKQLYITIGVSAFVIVGGIIAIVVVNKLAPKNDRQGKGDQNLGDKQQAKLKPDVPASFPLKKGSKGSNVTNVNVALGLAPSNTFSNETEAMLQKKFGVMQVTETQYNDVLATLKQMGVTIQ